LKLIPQQMLGIRLNYYAFGKGLSLKSALAVEATWETCEHGFSGIRSKLKKRSRESSARKPSPAGKEFTGFFRHLTFRSAEKHCFNISPKIDTGCQQKTGHNRQDRNYKSNNRVSAPASS